MKACVKTILIMAAALGTAALPVSADAGFRTGSHVKVVNCEEYISLREHPYADSEVIARVPLGSYLGYAGDAENGFSHVNFNGTNGYVLGDYLQVTEDFSGSPVSLTENTRYQINLFLSNFTEQGFVWSEGFFDRDVDPNSELIDFAVNHIWFNKKELIEYRQNDREQYGPYNPDFDNNTRLSVEYIPSVTERFFDRVPSDYRDFRLDYEDGYLYWEETGGHVPFGYATAYDVEDFGNGLISVWFKMAGDGSSWTNDDCYLTPEQAERKSGLNAGDGFALIEVGDLDDRSTFKMVRYAWRRSY